MADGVFSTLFGGGSQGSTSLAGAGIGAVGSIVGGFSQAQAASTQAAGYQQEANFYNQAAQVAGRDVGIVAAEGGLEQAALGRKIEMTEAQAETAEAGAGVGGGTGVGQAGQGTAGDILRSSQTQGALILGQAATQTQLQESNFQQMQLAYQAEGAGAEAASKAAQQSSSSGILGGILGAAGKLVPFLGGL